MPDVAGGMATGGLFPTVGSDAGSSSKGGATDIIGRGGGGGPLGGGPGVFCFVGEGWISSWGTALGRPGGGGRWLAPLPGDLGGDSAEAVAPAVAQALVGGTGRCGGALLGRGDGTGGGGPPLPAAVAATPSDVGGAGGGGGTGAAPRSSLLLAAAAPSSWANDGSKFRGTAGVKG
jgi:hypothetical protein